MTVLRTTEKATRTMMRKTRKTMMQPSGLSLTPPPLAVVAVTVLAAFLLVLAAGSGRAQADFGLTNFDGSTLDASGNPFTQAGGHPDIIKTTFGTNVIPDPAGGGRPVPDGQFKDVTVDLPPGLVGDASATAAKCTPGQLASADYGLDCPPASQIGTAYIITADGIPLPVGLYNMEPRPGVAAQFGFNILVLVQLEATVRGSDYGLRISASNVPQSASLSGFAVDFWGTPADHNPAITERKPFLREPTSCSGPTEMKIRMNEWADPSNFIFGSFLSHDNAVPTPNPIGNDGCANVPFTPSVSSRPMSRQAHSPTGLAVDISVPDDGIKNPDGIGQSDLKDVKMTLPEGMTINPTAANGLGACSEEQIALGQNRQARCPDNAKIGTVEMTTPLLSETLTGSVYQAEQDRNPFDSTLAIYIDAKNEARGIDIKLAGKVATDPQTGRVTVTFANNPQLPLKTLHLVLKSGSRAPLNTPSACGRYNIVTELTPWARPDEVVTKTSTFTIDQGCAGAGWFGPYFSAGTVNPAAGASSPFVLRVNKPDGQSALNGLALTLPEGLLANLKGNIGRQVGTAHVAAGVGPTPYWLSGPVVLEGPYGDAPFSLRVTVPAIAGPFNLGNVVVRQKIYVDPHDAHVTVVSDPLPTILRGIPVQLQSLQVNIDKAGFMRNPTSCAPKSVGGTLAALTGQTAPVASRFQVGSCAALPLQPKLAMDLTGKKETKRGKHPALSATLTQQSGESGLKKVKVRLPLSLALDPDNAEALCTPEQAAAKACPAASIVGHATAVTPILDQPLKGDVFFVEGTRKSKTGRTIKTLPKLWVALRGQVAIDVWADSAISQGKYLVTTFGFIPDAPISSFKLDINGGAHGILAVTGDTGASLCKQDNVTQATFGGQNGKQVTSNVLMGSPCGFGVRSTSLTRTHAKVTVSGIGAGRLSISGKGIHKAHRTIKRSDVATIQPRLTAAGMRAAKAGKALRLRVTFNPKQKGAKTRHARATIKRAKKESSTRAHRSQRTR